MTPDEQKRQARERQRRYAATPTGKEKHAARMRRYRERLRVGEPIQPV